MRNRAELTDRLITAAEHSGLHLPGWSKPEWDALLAGAAIVEIGDGELLIQRDATTRELFFLVEGQLEVTVPQSESLTLMPMFRITPGSVVGEIAFLDGGARSASVWARGSTVLFALGRQSFATFRREHPALACDLMHAIAQVLAVRLRRAVSGATNGSTRNRGLY